MLRQTWGRLIHKQWLLFYPLALGVISTIAFVAVYASSGRPLTWTTFFQANFERWQFVQRQLRTGFDFTAGAGCGRGGGLGPLLLTAMIRAPYFRAIAGPGYPSGATNQQRGRSPDPLLRPQ